MIRIGSLIETTHSALRVEVPPHYVALRAGEAFVRSPRTGQQFVAVQGGRPYLSPTWARVLLYTLTTETEMDPFTGRTTIYGRRGKMVTASARTLASNIH